MTTVTELPPSYLVMPSDDEVQRLRSYVLSEHSWLRSAPAGEAVRAFWVCGTFKRRPAPNSKFYYSRWIEIANTRLEAVHAPIGGQAFLVSCLSHGDVQWQKLESGVGALLEVGLDEFSGRSASNVWKDILRGERGLMRPVLADRGIQTSRQASSSSVSAPSGWDASRNPHVR